MRFVLIICSLTTTLVSLVLGGTEPPTTPFDSPSSTVQPCNLILSSDSTVWRPNQTLEIYFPLMEEEELIWDTSVIIQNGDMLVIKINDSSLVTDNEKPPEISIYSIIANYNSCDLAESTVLDVTPVVVDGRQLITFYDKDMSDGVNQFIVASESWGHDHCVKLKVLVKSDNCGDIKDCTGKGMCYSNTSMEIYECQCCPGYIGVHCEEQDACYPSPCLNNGICVDISQGHDGMKYQCLCPYGFTGKICQETKDPCDSSPCQHGAICSSSNLTAEQFKCDCLPGYGGKFCQDILDQCASSPCQNGICVDQHNGYRCYCQPGFSGDQCEYEYNECESSPCLNGGTCTDHIGSFSCTCVRGYTGKTCATKVDLCDPNPCSHHHYCNDKGSTYSCDCPKGFSGVNCLTPTKAACITNPCHNGGTCWSSIDTFYCACRPGFTGKICNEEVVFEIIPSSNPIEMNKNQQMLELQMGAGSYVDHLRNLYVAVGTLLCACLIVAITVAACYCRMHETYKRCFSMPTPFFNCNITRSQMDTKPTRLEVEKEHMEPLATRPYPAFENDMYYALDFSDSQSSPLIQ